MYKYMKKNLLYSLAALVAAFGISSCHGNVDPGTGNGGGETPEGEDKFVLSVSPEAIDADGKSAASFTVKLNEEDVTSKAVINCTTTGDNLSGNTFTTTQPGTYEFEASYPDLLSNKVTVTAYAVGEGLRMSVDKATIEADGVDVAKLQIIDEDNKVVTDDKNLLKYVSYTVVETGESQSRTNEFSAIANGTYTISAKYKGKAVANTVTVEAVNRGKYEKYFHMVPIYDITNIQCYYCSVVAEGLEEIPSPYKEHALTMAIHGPYDNNDPWLLSAVANDIQRRFESLGAYPSVIYNLADKAPAQADEYTGVGIGKRVRQQMLDNPATCGVKLDTKFDETAGKVTLTVSMMPTKAGKFDIGCALLLDNQKVDQGMSTLFQECNDIVVNISGNYAAMSEKAVNATADNEESREFEMDLPSDVVAKCGGIGNFRVVGFVICEDGSSVRFDNAAVCGLGSSIDYKLN